MENRPEGVLLNQDPKRVAGTVDMLRKYRANKDVINVVTGDRLERKMHWLIDVAINRKAGVPDAFPSEMHRGQGDEILRAADRIRRDDPELPVRTAHFEAPMRRALRAVLNADPRTEPYWKPLPKPVAAPRMRA